MLYFSHAKRVFPLMAATRKRLSKEMSKDDIDFDACTALSKSSSLEAIFSAAKARQTLPSYWKNFIVDVSLPHYIAEGTFCEIRRKHHHCHHHHADYDFFIGYFRSLT